MNDLSTLGDGAYLRERIAPSPGDEFYIPLIDMLSALKRLAPFDAAKVLDFGCGGSPYKGFFSGEYVRADIALNPDREITIGENSGLPSELSGFDLVLSTQVLEHVESPEAYLGECWRVLAPGGRLFLSTHGHYEEHGSPDDFWRWTANGLARLVRAQGFTIDQMLKLTCNARASLFQLERDLRLMGPGRKVGKLFPPLFAAMRKLGRRRLHEFSDYQYPDLKICDALGPESPARYTGLALMATKPGN